MDSLSAARHRARVVWMIPAVIGTLVIGSLAFAPSAARALQGAAATPVAVSGPLSASVDLSPFSPNGDDVRDRTRLTVVLAAPATLNVVVRNYDGAAIKTLAKKVSEPAGTSTWSWDGTGAKKKLVADGAYVFRATAITANGTFSVDGWMAKDKLIPYPAAPNAVVVAIDSGHGAPDSGAYYQTVREADMNMDIALRLQHMLESSGIQVVMTHTVDAAPNTPPVDVNADGTITKRDDLIVRNDLANLARADLHVVLMNNAYGCHCAHGTETYTSGERTWTPEGVDLARYVQAAHISRLKPFKTAAWKPKNRGVKLWDFAAIRPYQKKEMPRPDLMPSILVESLFMDHPNELAVLTTPAVRAALATAYFDGIVKWLTKRSFGLRYDVLSAPPVPVEVGGTADYSMQLTNRGNAASSGWTLEARMVSAAAGQPYDGSPVRGTLVAETPVPDGLAPGQAVDVALNNVPLPTVGGDWLVKFDVRLPGGGSLQDHGVVGPQLALTTTEPPPPPTPTPEPTAEASASPSPESPSPESPSPESPSPDPATAPPTETPADTATPVPADTPISDDSGQGHGAAPAGNFTPDATNFEVTAVSPHLFRRSLPFDPVQNRPGVGGLVIWGRQALWRQYVTPIDIPPELPINDLERHLSGAGAGAGPAQKLGLQLVCSIR